MNLLENFKKLCSIIFIFAVLALTCWTHRFAYMAGKCNGRIEYHNERVYEQGGMSIYEIDNENNWEALTCPEK